MTKYLIFIIFLFGCYNQKKATTQFNKAVLSYPKIPLYYCAERFPDKPDSVIVRTDTIINIATMDSLVYDTLLLNHDTTLIRTIVKTQKIYIKKDSIIYRENKAEQERLRLELDKCQHNNNVLLDKLDEKDKLIADWKKKAKTRWLWIALLIGGAAAYTAFKIWKPKINI
jgi:hypothetical protein